MKNSKSSRPALSYSVYLLLIFAILVLIVVGLNGTQLRNYCPNREIDCQIYLQQGQVSPYRDEINAKTSGWYYAGHVAVDTCWVGWPKFCEICQDNIAMRTKACQQKFPNFITRPGVGIKMNSQQSP